MNGVATPFFHFSFIFIVKLPNPITEPNLTLNPNLKPNPKP